MSPSLGIYGLFKRPWIYIGETGNIRGRLLEHLADDGPWSARHRPSALAFELVSSTCRRPRQQELVNEVRRYRKKKAIACRVAMEKQFLRCQCGSGRVLWGKLSCFFSD